MAKGQRHAYWQNCPFNREIEAAVYPKQYRELCRRKPTMVCFLSFLYNFARVFIVAQRDEFGVAKAVSFGPFQKLDDRN